MPTPPKTTHRRLEDEIGMSGPFASPEQEAYLNLVRTEHILVHQTMRLFRRHGLSEATYNILRILRGHRRQAERDGRTWDGLSCAVIQSDMLTPVPDLTRLLDRLCKEGFADRQRSPEDRRVVLSRITEKGMRILAELDGPLHELHRAQLGHLTTRELRQFTTLLTKARSPHLAAERAEEEPLEES
jgi:DNA-binding MarR family transcriptional regulator